MRLTLHMWQIMVTCVDIHYVEENGIRQNICGANADEILTTCRTNYDTIITAPNLIVELRTELEPILEVTIFLDHLILDLII